MINIDGFIFYITTVFCYKKQKNIPFVPKTPLKMTVCAKTGKIIEKNFLLLYNIFTEKIRDYFIGFLVFD